MADGPDVADRPWPEDRQSESGVTNRERFVREHTRLRAVPFVPEIQLYLADDAFGLWEQTAAEASSNGPPIPFWAFAWAGGLVLARYLLDDPKLVAGRTVLDVGAGSGLVGIAAAICGAATVTASEIDPVAVTAIALNCAANGVTMTVAPGDGLDGDGTSAEVVLAGDLFYEQPLADRVLPFLDRAQARGASILIGDLGRRYLPRDRLEAVATYEVPVTRTLEDAEVKRTTVWRLI